MLWDNNDEHRSRKCYYIVSETEYYKNFEVRNVKFIPGMKIQDSLRFLLKFKHV